MCVVDSAANDVHLQARDTQLLLSASVQVADLGDGRHLSKQTEVVAASLFDADDVAWRSCVNGAGHLSLDLLQKLLDARARPGRLLTLKVSSAA
jgi:hypothetical protein